MHGVQPQPVFLANHILLTISKLLVSVLWFSLYVSEMRKPHNRSGREAGKIRAREWAFSAEPIVTATRWCFASINVSTYVIFAREKSELI